MRTTPAVHVHTEIRGDVPKFVAGLAAAKVGSLLRMAPEPVLFARVTLTMAADQAVGRPAAVLVNVDLNGRLIHVGAAAVTAREAVERMGDRLRIRLERAARNWAATRGGKPVSRQHEWRHESIPRTRTPYFPRPPEERTTVRRTSYARAPQTPAEAAADLEALGFEFHLFTDQATGQDSVIYRADGGYRMARARPGTGWPGPASASITVSDRAAPGSRPPPRWTAWRPSASRSCSSSAARPAAAAWSTTVTTATTASSCPQASGRRGERKSVATHSGRGNADASSAPRRDIRGHESARSRYPARVAYPAGR